MTLRLGLGLLLVFLIGCRVEDASVSADVDSLAVEAPTLAPEAAPVAPPVQQAVMPLLAIDADGLRIVNPETGATQPIAFGSGKTEVLRTLETLRGPAQPGRNDECGAGPLTFADWSDGLGLVFQDTVFVGWGVDGGDEGAEVFTTLAGLGVGSTRALLDSAYVADVQETSRGTEFVADGLYGLLDDEARITTLWAGTACTFR